jgi:NADPH2:quinone reductase
MALAIRIHAHGGPEEFKAEEIAVRAPGAGEVRLKQTAIGLNYIDTYHRSGLYPLEMPGIVGMEAAAIVTAVGDGVTTVKEGDRVAYASGPVGAYAAERLMPAGRVVTLPDSIDDQTAAAMMVKGITAEYLLRRTYPVKKGDTILVHAAAGGVGLILCQWGNHLGATIIATAGSAEKLALAKANGAHHLINYRAEDFVQRVKEITGGKGVHVVYDGVGADTFMGSLDCLRPLGYMVSYGNASGPVPAFEPKILASKGSLFLTRPSLWHYTMNDEDYQASAKALFEVVEKGVVKIAVNQTYKLEDAARAHRDLESRATTGSTVLIP